MPNKPGKKYASVAKPKPPTPPAPTLRGIRDMAAKGKNRMAGDVQKHITDVSKSKKSMKSQEGMGKKKSMPKKGM